MSYINQYLEFLKPEKRVPKNQISQGNIYRIVRYGNDTQRGTSARYIFVIGTVKDKGRTKVHCIKINEVVPSALINLLRKLRNKSRPITENYKDLASLLKSFDREGSRLFNGFIKNNRAVYSRGLANYRTYFVDQIQYVSEVVLEFEELSNLLGEKTEAQKVIKEDRSEND